MPPFSCVLVKHLECPSCFAPLAADNLIGFQWGFCRGVFASADYRIGDPIMWRLDRAGKIPKWSYFSDSSGNIGDPSYSSLIVRESERDLRRCPHCDHPFAGVGIRIEGGIIQDVRVYQDRLPDADISLVAADGSLTPMPEWNDYPMPDIVDGGWRVRLIRSTGP